MNVHQIIATVMIFSSVSVIVYAFRLRTLKR
jgi:hypothetical protein